uniref:Reverse transcriptase domain-containing protein n=1 Tax=Equus caballus TaxID=9796 RepID=A0A9L0SHE0_HORSE
MADPVMVKPCPGTKISNLKQYPLKKHAKEGIKPLIATFLKCQLIRPCQSPYNTPILPIQKPRTRDYRFIQDLKAINEIVEDIHPMVLNPYTLLTTLSGDFCWFTVLDLKDTFFCVLLTPASQELFAFEWDNPETSVKQYCWMVLPQGFKNAPTIFGEDLAKDLRDLQLNEGVLLQYVDGILIASETKEASDQNTILTLNFLAEQGYRVFKGKAQIFQPTVKYLGFELSRRQRNLLLDQREALARVAVLTTRRQ